MRGLPRTVFLSLAERPSQTVRVKGNGLAPAHFELAKIRGVNSGKVRIALLSATTEPESTVSLLRFQPQLEQAEVGETIFRQATFCTFSDLGGLVPTMNPIMVCTVHHLDEMRALSRLLATIEGFLESVVAQHQSGVPILAPMSGTLYLQPAPDKKPFVRVGETVVAGQVVAMVEAMKTFSDLQAPCPGVLSSIEVSNGVLVSIEDTLGYIQPGA